MNGFQTSLLIVAFYLLGSVPFGAIVAKLVKNVDIRKVGSGNIGATNVFRTLGLKWGLFVFVLDFAKGLLPSLLSVSIFGKTSLALITASASFFGHVFSIFLKFRGGKGIATGFGVVVPFLGVYSLVPLVTFVITLLITRIVSVSSLTAAVFVPLTYFLFIFPKTGDTSILYLLIAASVFAFYTHRENIKRLLKGEERRVKK